VRVARVSGRIRLLILRLFDVLRVVPSVVEGRQAQDERRLERFRTSSSRLSADLAVSALIVV
jgi:hypothetical protein